MHYPRTCEITITMPETIVGPKRCKPTPTPCPVRKQRVRDGCEKNRRQCKSGKLPALCAGAGYNGSRSIHKNHLEQEQNHHRHIVRSPLRQKETVRAKEAPGFPKKVDTEFSTQRSGASEIADGTHSAHLERETAHPIGKQAESINHKVHHHSVVRVLGAAQARFN